MTKRSLAAAGVLAALSIAVPVAVQQAGQSAKPSPERAQDQPLPPGSPFALLPGFKIERVTPADKTESLIVVTFDALGRPVVSQSVSGNGVEPRILLDNDGDGIFESEKIVSTKLNTCHGLFYASRTTLYANCRAVMPGDPPPGQGGRGGGPPPAGTQPAAGTPPPAAAPPQQQQQQQPPPPPPPPAQQQTGAPPPAQQQAAAAPDPQAGRGGGRGGGGGGNQADSGIAGLYKLEDIDGD